MRASEKYDSWMHSTRCVHTVHSRAVTAQPLFMFLSAQLRTRSAKQIKMFSRDFFPAFSAVRIGTMPQSVINREIDCSFCVYACFNLSYSCVHMYVSKKNLDGNLDYAHMRIARVRILRATGY